MRLCVLHAVLWQVIGRLPIGGVSTLIGSGAARTVRSLDSPAADFSSARAKVAPCRWLCPPVALEKPTTAATITSACRAQPNQKPKLPPKMIALPVNPSNPTPQLTFPAVPAHHLGAAPVYIPSAGQQAQAHDHLHRRDRRLPAQAVVARPGDECTASSSKKNRKKSKRSSDLIVLNRFSRGSKLCAARHAPCDMTYEVSMLIGVLTGACDPMVCPIHAVRPT